ncbi:MAG: hypothetical protein GY904_27120 [Planctomycetaceae bacterium]|nr:hypothetical protein [Planctomycetaceae bacterium]
MAIEVVVAMFVGQRQATTPAQEITFPLVQVVFDGWWARVMGMLCELAMTKGLPDGLSHDHCEDH